MTHPAFRADLDELDTLAAALVRTGHSVQDALAALHDTTAASIGTGSLDRACQDFQQHWGQQLRQLQQQVGDTAEGVRDTARGYRRTEHGLTALLNAVPVRVPAPAADPARLPAPSPEAAPAPAAPGAQR